MQNLTLDDLLDILADSHAEQEDKDTAIAELRDRLAVLSKGGDRPTKPPLNP